MAGNPLTTPSDDEVLFGSKGAFYAPGGGGFPGSPGGPSPGGAPGGAGAGVGFLGRALYNPTTPIGAYRKLDMATPTRMGQVSGSEGQRTGNPLADALGAGDSAANRYLIPGMNLGRLPGPGTGGNAPYDPNNPYGTFTGDTRGDLSGLVNRIIGALGKGGNLDPNSVPPELLAMLKELGIGNQGEYEARARTSMDARGGMTDPALYGATVANAGTQAQSDLSRAMSGAGIGLAQHQNDQLMQILQMALGNNDQGQLMRLQGQLQPKQGLDWGQMIGGIGGSAIGALLGPHP